MGVQESSSHSSSNPWTAGMRVEKKERAWLKESRINVSGINVIKVGYIQELWNILMNVSGIKCLNSDVGKIWFWAELVFFYGYFRVFCSEPAGGGRCGGSRCFRFEWQVVIYADLCSQSEPPDKSIISYYSMQESNESHFCIVGFVLQHMQIHIYVTNMSQAHIEIRQTCWHT